MSTMRGILFSLPSSSIAKARAMVRHALLGHHKESIKLLKINEVEEYRDGQMRLIMLTCNIVVKNQYRVTLPVSKM